MEVSELIQPTRIVVDLDVEDKPALLKVLANRASRATDLDAQTISDLLTTREALGSTGIGRGVAIPHASVGGLNAPFALFARLHHPIAFESIDGMPVDLVFLLLTPAASRNLNVSALAAITRRLRDSLVLKGLREAKSPSELYARLARADI